MSVEMGDYVAAQGVPAKMEVSMPKIETKTEKAVYFRASAPSLTRPALTTDPFYDVDWGVDMR